MFANHAFVILFQVMDKATLTLDKIQKEFEKVAQSVNKVEKQMNYFDMRAMGQMFAMMGLQRRLGGALKELFSVYQHLENKNDAFFGATQHLSASWEFLKYSIVSALSTPWLVNFIMDIVAAFKATSEWVQKNGELVAVLIGSSGLLYAVSSIGAVLFEYKLGAASFFGVAGQEAASLEGTINRISGKQMFTSGLVAAVSIVKNITDDSKITATDIFGDLLASTMVFATMGGGDAGAAVAGGLFLINMGIKFQKDPFGLGESLGYIASQMILTYNAVFTIIGKMAVNLGNMMGSYIANSVLAPIIKFWELVDPSKAAKLESVMSKLYPKVTSANLFSGISADSFGALGTGFKEGFASGMVPAIDSGAIGTNALFSMSEYLLYKEKSRTISNDELLVEYTKTLELQKQTSEIERQNQLLAERSKYVSPITGYMSPDVILG